MPKNLRDRIESSRITYPDTPSGGKTIEGSPLSLEFERPINPKEFVDEISNPTEPWNFFAITTKLTEGYWKVNGVIFGIEGDTLESGSKLDMEVSEDWIRFYVKEDANVDLVIPFIETIDEKYGLNIDQ